MMLRVGPDVYPEVKIINSATGLDLFCLLPPKARTYYDKSGWWAKDVLSYSLNPFSSPFAYPYSFTLQSRITQKKFGKPLFHNAFNESEMKAFSSKFSYLSSWDVASFLVLFFFLPLTAFEILVAFIRKPVAGFCSWLYIEIFDFQKKKKKIPPNRHCPFTKHDWTEMFVQREHGWQLHEAWLLFLQLTGCFHFAKKMLFLFA